MAQLFLLMCLGLPCMAYIILAHFKHLLDAKLHFVSSTPFLLLEFGQSNCFAFEWCVYATPFGGP